MNYFNRIPLFFLLVLFCLPAAAQKPSTKNPKLDLYGDPLPEGAIARMGTLRFRHHYWTWSVAISPDGKTIVSGSSWFIKLWDTSTGKPKGELFGAGNAIVFSSDGKQLLTFGEEQPTRATRVIRLWDFKTKKILWQIDSEKSSPQMGPNVRTLAFHPDGKRIVAHLTNGSIFLLDRETGMIGEFSYTQKSFLGGSSVFAISTDGTQAAVGDNQIIEIVKIPKFGKSFEKADKIETLKISKGKLTALKFLSENLLIAAIHYEVVKRNGEGIYGRVEHEVSIEIWNVSTKKRVGKLSPPKNREAVSAMVLSSDGNTLYASHQRWIDTWDLKKRKRISELPQLSHLNRGMTNSYLLALSKDETILASAGNARMIQLWKLPERKSTLPEKIGHHRIIKTITWTPDGHYLVSGSHDGTVRFWEPSTGKEVKRFVYSENFSQINEIGISSDGRTLVAVGTGLGNKPSALGGMVKIWDIASEKVIREIRHAQQSESVAISRDGKLIAFDSPNPFVQPLENKIFVYETLTGKKLRELDALGRRIHAVGFSQNSKTLIASSHKAGIFRWNLRSGKELERIIGQNYVRNASFASDSEQIALFGNVNSGSGVRVFDFVTGKAKRFPMEFQPGQGFPRSFAYTSLSRFGGLLATKKGSFSLFGNNIVVVDTLTGKIIFSTGPVDLVTDVALSPDGSKLATSLHNGTILIWEVYQQSSKAKIAKESSSLQNDWELLSATNMSKVWEAIDRMTRQPDKTVKLLSSKLFPKKEYLPQDVKNLISKLESGSFRERRRAFYKLKSYGQIILNELQQAARNSNSTEAKNRCKKLIEAAQIQNVRAIQILEMIGSNQSRELLKRIAKENPQKKMAGLAKRVLTNMEMRR